MDECFVHVLKNNTVGKNVKNKFSFSTVKTFYSAWTYFLVNSPFYIEFIVNMNNIK